jgi:cytosine/uracil/thiamine/allantoin permease
MSPRLKLVAAGHPHLHTRVFPPGVITAVLGAVIMPWRLLSSSSAFVGWLVAYSSLLGRRV